MKSLFDELMDVAENYDVRTPKDRLVLYSISFLPTKENRNKAFLFVQENEGFVTIENTVCGKELVDRGICEENLSSDEKSQIWATASARLIKEAKGNITVFVDGADERSVFYSVELPEILKNKNIVKINGKDKNLFVKNFLY